MTPKRKSAVAIVIGMALLSCSTALCEMLPTSGTAEGIYHQDPWGVGRVGYYIVHPALHAQLRPYEGRQIRFKIVKAEQLINPGPAIVHALDEIEVLPPLPIEIRIQTVPAQVRAGQPFHVVVETINRSKDSALYLPHQSVSFRQADDRPKTGKPWLLLNVYTEDQVGIKDEPLASDGGRAGDFSLKIASAPVTLIPPGGSQLSAVFSSTLPRADGELSVAASCAFAKSGTPFGTWSLQGNHQIWANLPVKNMAPAIPREPLLLASQIELTHSSDEWSKLCLRLRPAPGKTVRVPAMGSTATRQSDPQRWFQHATLRASAADGTPVALEAIRFPETGADADFIHVQNLPADGMTLAGRFRKNSRYAPAINRISLDVLTDAGFETVEITDTFHDPDVVAETPFGPVTEGVKLRIRPAKSTFRAGDPLAFHFQVANVSGKPVCWWKPANDLGDNIRIEIDKKPIDMPAIKAEYIGGWAAAWTCQTAMERTVTLPAGLSLAKGRHTLRYSIVSKGGTYTNAQNSPIPLLPGELQSNETEFAVE